MLQMKQEKFCFAAMIRITFIIDFHKCQVEIQLKHFYFVYSNDTYSISYHLLELLTIMLMKSVFNYSNRIKI